jgi:hypothetical protein
MHPDYLDLFPLGRCLGYRRRSLETHWSGEGSRMRGKRANAPPDAGPGAARRGGPTDLSAAARHLGATLASLEATVRRAGKEPALLDVLAAIRAAKRDLDEAKTLQRRGVHSAAEIAEHLGRLARSVWSDIVPGALERLHRRVGAPWPEPGALPLAAAGTASSRPGRSPRARS